LFDGSYAVVSYVVDQPCDIWWEENRIIVERTNPKPYQNHFIHLLNGKPVIGYICNY
jgi:hypothetical protein